MTFDASQFINSTVSGPMSTSVVVCPEGEWTAIIGDSPLEDWFRTVEWTDKKNGQPRSSPAVRIPFLITDDRAKALAKRDTLYASMDAFIDIDPQGNMDISEGKNVKLGQLRSALNQNQNNVPWSFSQLRGAGPLIVKIAHRSFDSSDPSRKIADVVRCLRLT